MLVVGIEFGIPVTLGLPILSLGIARITSGPLHHDRDQRQERGNFGQTPCNLTAEQGVGERINHPVRAHEPVPLDCHGGCSHHQNYAKECVHAKR